MNRDTQEYDYTHLLVFGGILVALVLIMITAAIAVIMAYFNDYSSGVISYVQTHFKCIFFVVLFGMSCIILLVNAIYNIYQYREYLIELTTLTEEQKIRERSNKIILTTVLLLLSFISIFSGIKVLLNRHILLCSIITISGFIISELTFFTFVAKLACRYSN